MSGSLRATWHAITWRKLLIFQIVGAIATYLDSRESSLFGTWMGHPSEAYVSTALAVFLVVPIALLSDEVVKQGARPRVAYSIALISTLPITFIAMTVTQRAYLWWFGLAPGTPDQFWQSSIGTSFHMYIYVAFAMLVFMNQRTADRMLENFRNSELRRVQLEQQLVESRLAMAEAQIDPSMLFAQLGDIKAGLQRDADGAEEQLNELIQTLRAALARTVRVHEPGANPLS